MTPKEPPDRLADLARKAAELPRAAIVEREPTQVKGFPGPKAPGTGLPLPPPRQKQPSLRDLDAVTAIQRAPSRQDARSEATDTPIGPQGPRREMLPERQREPRSMSPAPWDPRASSPELRRETERMGDRLVPAPESKPSVPPKPPARSLSPVPWSSGREGVSGEGVALRWTTLKKAAPWVLAFLGLGGGTTGGYFVGLKQARAEVADLQADTEDHEKRLAKREKAAATLSKTVDAIDESLKSEAQERRSDVGKLRDDVKGIRESLPRVEGLRPR